MKKVAGIVLVLFYLSAGINHFRHPGFYSGLIPPYLQSWTNAINTASGLAEIGLALLWIPAKTRLIASYGLLLMLLAFIPAHVYFLQINSCIPDGLCVPQWLGWIRLVLIHPLLLIWVWWCRKQ